MLLLLDMYDLLSHTAEVTNPMYRTVAMPRGSQPITVVQGVTTARISNNATGYETERETARTGRTGTARTERTSRETVTRPTVTAVTGTGTGAGTARNTSRSLTRTASAPVFQYSNTPLVVEAAAPTIQLKSKTGATLTYTLVPSASQTVVNATPAPVQHARGSAPAPAQAPVAAAQQRVASAAAARRTAETQQSASSAAASAARLDERRAARDEHSAMVKSSSVKPKIRERSDDVLRDSFGRMLVDHETLAPVTVVRQQHKQGRTRKMAWG